MKVPSLLNLKFYCLNQSLLLLLLLLLLYQHMHN